PSPQGERESFNPLGRNGQPDPALTALMRDSTMPTNVFLLSLAAGIISAGLFWFSTTGAMLLRVVLFFLTPLSLYLAGLGLGTVATAIAGITASSIVLIICNRL